MKRVLCAMVSLACVLGLTVSASAIGYAGDPGYTYTPPKGYEKEVQPTSLEKSVQSGAVIDVSKGGKISLASLENLLNEYGGKSLLFACNQAGNEYQLTIPLSTVTKPRSINAYIELSKKTGEVNLYNLRTLPANSLHIQPSMSGNFGMEFQLTFPSTHFKSIRSDKGKKPIGMMLVYVNEERMHSEVMEKLIPFGEKGEITITISKASSYYLAPVYEEEKPVVNEEVENDWDDDGGIEVDDSTGDKDTDKPSSKNNDKNDTTKPSGDKTSGNNDKNDNNSGSNPWWNSDGGELNPPTGMTLGISGLVAVLASGTAVLVTRHRRRR